MPKIVDADQRREHIVDAVLRLVERRGVSAASLRNVATEAALNVGSVRHYFTSHSELLLAAATTMADRVAARITTHVARFDGAGTEDDRLEILLDTLMELLPVDETRRAECVIFLAFAEHSRTMPSLQAATGDLFRGPRELAGAAFTNTHLGEVDTEMAVLALSAVVDGLTLLGVHRIEECPAEKMRQVLRWQVQSSFASHPGSDSRH